MKYPPNMAKITRAKGEFIRDIPLDPGLIEAHHRKRQGASPHGILSDSDSLAISVPSCSPIYPHRFLTPSSYRNNNPMQDI